MFRDLFKLKVWRALAQGHKSGSSLLTSQYRPSSERSFASLAASRTGPWNLTLPTTRQMSVSQNETNERPVWFIFSGVGSYSPGVGKSLLRLPAFAASVERWAATLEPYGVDLRHVIASEATSDIMSIFVSVSTIQLALADLLRDLGVQPDGIIGFSNGDIGAGYVDGAVSAEQALAFAPVIVRSIADARLPPGATAIIDRSWKDVAARCSPDIDCAAHLLSDKIIVTGPPASIKKLVSELSSEGVSVRLSDTMGIPFHSRYVAPAAKLLGERLQPIFSPPKLRSKRWLSCAFPPDQWGSDIAKLLDGAYCSNLLLSPVYLSETLSHVPAHARVIELAPHAFLQSTLKRALPSAEHVPLLRREAPDAVEHLLKALEYIAPGARERQTLALRTRTSGLLYLLQPIWDVHIESAANGVANSNLLYRVILGSWS